jgi:hypothetical protein
MQLWKIKRIMGDINTTWNTIKENIKILTKESLIYCESKHDKPRFNKECSKLDDRRQQAKVQWLQDSSEVNEDNLCNVGQETNRHFRKKKKEYLKDRINKLQSNSNNKNITDPHRSTNEFKKSYKLRTNLVKDKRNDLFMKSLNILNRWKNYFCQLLNVHGQVVLGRLKCIQLSNLCHSLVPLRLRLLLES